MSVKRFSFLLLAICGILAESILAQETVPLEEIVEETSAEATQTGDPAPIPEPRVTGLLYTHPFYAFSVKLPSEDWQYLLDRETIATYNADALVVMIAPDLDLYSMIIIEELPDLSVEKYAEMVQPSLEDLVRISGEPFTLADLPAYRQVWEGKFDGIAMRFHYTLLAKEHYRMQIISWCAKSNWDESVESQFHSLGLSVTDLGPSMVRKEPPWFPPRQPAPEDIHTNSKLGFSVTKPSEAWTFITDRDEILSINAEASLVIQKGEEAFSMILIERLPDLSLSEYAGKVIPNLEGATLLEEVETTIGGLEARRRQWRGKFGEIRYDFFYALLADGENRIQIVSWAPTSKVDDNIRAQIRYIEDSFLTLGTASPSPEDDPLKTD